LFMILGGILGCYFGELMGLLIPTGFLHDVFTRGIDLGFTEPLVLSLRVIVLTFGIKLYLNLFGVVGMIAGLYYSNYFSAVILLGSQSPRRRRILAFVGVSFKVLKPIGVSEKAKRGEEPCALVRRLALAKALSVSRRHPTDWVLGADTLVTRSGKILGKPRN